MTKELTNQLLLIVRNFQVHCLQFYTPHSYWRNKFVEHSEETLQIIPHRYQLWSHVFKFYQLTFRILFLNEVVYDIWISYMLGCLWGKLYSQFDFYISISLIENYIVVIEMKYSDWQASKLLPSCCVVI